MTAAMVYPLRFTASSANPASTLPVTNANIDQPGMIWAGATSSYLVIDLGNLISIDTVALIGTNLQASDTWRYRFGGDAAGVSGLDSGTMAAFTGYKPDGNRADCISTLGGPITTRFIRIDVNSPSNPDGMVTIQRIVIGKRVEFLAVDYDAEQTILDDSIITSGAGYTSVDEYATRNSWKVNMSWIKEDAWRQGLKPLYDQAGSSRGVLFIPDISRPDQFQTDAIFGRITSKPSGKCENYDGWSTNPTIEAMAPKARAR